MGNRVPRWPRTYVIYIILIPLYAFQNKNMISVFDHPLCFVITEDIEAVFRTVFTLE